MVTLRQEHHPTADYVRILRRKLAEEFPGVVFYALPADMTSQVLNFGLPSPIDVQIEGSDLANNRIAANRILSDLRHVPGLTDLHIHQPSDYPRLHIDIDRIPRRAGRLHHPRRHRQHAQLPQRQHAGYSALLSQLG